MCLKAVQKRNGQFFSYMFTFTGTFYAYQYKNETKNQFAGSMKRQICVFLYMSGFLSARLPGDPSPGWAFSIEVFVMAMRIVAVLITVITVALFYLPGWLMARKGKRQASRKK